MSTLTDWISAIASSITALGIVFLWYQIFVMKKNIDIDNEKSRREYAVNLILEWSKSLKRYSSISRKLVETFNEEQARKLWKSESFYVELDKKDLVEASLATCDDKEQLKLENEKIILTNKQSAFLRWTIICYLNFLESILIAKRHGIADKEIIKEEFRYLVKPQEGHSILKNFRKACGGNVSYPAIEEFAIELEGQNNVFDGKKEINYKNSANGKN